MKDAEDTKMEISLGPGKGRVCLKLETQPNPKIEDLKAGQYFDYQQDEFFSKVYRALRNHKIEGTPLEPKYSKYKLENQEIVWLDGSGDDRRVVPCGQRIPLIKEFHDSPLGGHFGPEKVYASLKRYFFWPGMKGLIQKYIQTCDLCQKSNLGLRNPWVYPKSQTLPWIAGRWSLWISVDPFP